jgi:hypothetical protein
LTMRMKKRKNMRREKKVIIEKPPFPARNVARAFGCVLLSFVLQLPKKELNSMP